MGMLSTGLNLRTEGTCRARLPDEGAVEAGGILGLSLETSQEHSLRSQEGHDGGRVNSGVGMVKGQGRDVGSHM